MKPYSTIRHFQLQCPVIKAYYHESLFYIVDSKNTLYILNKNYEQKLKLKLLSDDYEQHNYSHNYSIANGIVSFSKANNIICTKYDDAKVSVIYKKESASKEIVYTALNKDANMLLGCSVDGRAFIVNPLSKFHCYTFENQPDYCSSAFFSAKDIFVYIGYFNLQNKILNLKDLTLMEFEVKHPIESGTFFDNDTKLFLADRAGNSIVYDCMDDKVISTKALFNEWVSCTAVHNEKYIFVGTRKDKLYILNACENELLATINMDSHGMTSINIIEEKLIISYADSSFHTIDINYLKENFILHLNLHEYTEAKQILDQNLFLYTDESMKKFEAGFEKVVLKAKEFISKGKIDEALKIVEPFMGYLKFRHQLDTLFMQQDHIANFIEAVEKNDIQTAYALAEKYHVIPTLGTYNILEKQWEKAFAQAKKEIEVDNLHGKNKAKVVLEPYSKITQKSEIVKQLLFNSDKFVLADKLIKQQDFQKYFDLTKRFTFLKDTLLYQKIDTLASSLKTKAMQALSDNNTQEAIKIYTQLLVFPDYTAYSKKNIDEITAKMKLETSIESNDMKAVYEHVYKHSFLAYEDIFLKYNLRFEQDFKNAQLSIEKNNAAFAIKTLSKYFSIQYLDKKIANLFKHAYLREIENSNLKDHDTTTVILKYKKLVGIDEEIKEVFKNKQMEQEFKYALKSNASIDVDKFPESILS